MGFLENNDTEATWLDSGFSYAGGTGGYYNQSGISSYPTCASTIGNCPCSYGGCMDSGATNYDNKATCDDGSCQYAPPPPLPQFGCTQVGSLNYDPNANTDDGSCISPVSGCTDPNATNYNPNANVGCSSNFSGYSNFNQQGFGGYEDRLWFN
mgnify:FL=1|jgi:hypothetical protein|tara:strand:+ start:1767 stop:2225 length:459 start_codon:yes stop_codon:yes gene_type:complete